MRRLVTAVLVFASVTYAGTAEAFPGIPGRITFASDRANGHYELFTMDADGGAVAQLTHDGAWARYPAWSPDGSKIAYQSTDGDWELYVVNADGSDRRQLTNNTASDSYPAWTPDGKHIAFESNRNGTVDIFQMAVDGSDVKPLVASAAHDIAPSFSPDGGKLAFLRVVSTNPYTVGLYLADAAGFGEAKVATAGNADMPRWSPDSTKIVYVDTAGGDNEIWTVDANGGNKKQITNNTFDDYAPSFAPDGSKLLFEGYRPLDGTKIRTLNLDGTGEVALTKGPAGISDESPDWQATPPPPPSSPLPVAPSLPEVTLAPLSSPPARQTPSSPKPTVLRSPTISKISKRTTYVRCSTGAWLAADTIRVSWLRDGKRIAGVRGRSYKLRSRDQGKRLACRVTASNAVGRTLATSRSVKVPRPARV